jgi:hypothetical protein
MRSFGAASAGTAELGSAGERASSHSVGEGGNSAIPAAPSAPGENGVSAT